MKNLIKNWRTTSAGIAAICTGIAAILKGDYVIGVGSVSAGIGLLGAKDYNVTGGSKPINSENK